MSQVRDLSAFISSAVRAPGVVGAIAPSGRHLADVLAAVAPVDPAATVVELGPGTGVVSAALRRRLPTEARQVAVEVDPGMVAHLRRTRPWLEVVEGDAAHLQQLLAGAGITRADAVVSGLPFTLFPDAAQEAIVDQITRVLADGATFTTFAYSHVQRVAAQRRFRALLERRFDEVVVTPKVWRNLPPAIAYRARRPVAAG